MSSIVVISAQSLSGLSSQTHSQFGRATAFVFIDENTGQVVNQLKNGSAEAPHGAGTGAAAMLAGQKVKTVLAGNFGSKAFTALSRLEIGMWLIPEQMTVQEAFSRYQSRQLAPMKVTTYE